MLRSTVSHGRVQKKVVWLGNPRAPIRLPSEVISAASKEEIPRFTPVSVNSKVAVGVTTLGKSTKKSWPADDVNAPRRTKSLCRGTLVNEDRHG